MFKSILLTALFLTISIAGFTQTTIIGQVTDATQAKPMPGATVTLMLQKDSSLVKNVVSDNAGNFKFVDVANDSFIVTVNTVNFQQYVSFITIQNNTAKDLGSLQLTPKGKDLETVTIIARAPAVVQKGDTTQFSASEYKVNPDATTEDLIKKMPGITVAKDGTVTAQGEQVRKVTVDGKDFFGDDATATLRNLPSSIVDKIQVFDKLSDQAQLTGFDDGNSQKSINIVTKTSIKNGQFGRVYAGYGTNDRYAAGGNMSFFNGDRRLSIVGNFNNINQQNFGSQDLLGIASSGRGGGGRGNRGGGGGSSDNFSVGQSSGISKTNALGLNFSDKYGEKVSLSASYFYNNSANTNNSQDFIQTFGRNGNNIFTNQQSNSYTSNYNHRFNARLEYKIDSNNTLYVIPSVSFQGNNYDAFSTVKNYYGANDSISNSIINSMDDRTGYNINNNIMFRHSFAKKGRSLSLGFNSSFNKTTGNSITDAAYRFFENNLVQDSAQDRFSDNLTDGQKYSGNISYTEPIGKKGQLQFEYAPSVQYSTADQQTFQFDGQKYSLFDTTLSNKFDNTITTQRGGVSYRLVQNKDNMIMIGLNYQSAQLESNRIFPLTSSVKQSFSDLLPNGFWRSKISDKSNIRLFFRSSVNFPSVTQLQDVVNLTNPLYVSSGNPGLKQSNTSFLGGRYTFINTKKNQSFFANIFLQTASNYISNATYITTADSTIQQGIVLKRGSQLSKPVNLDGYRSLRSYFTYSMPVKAIKTTVNLTTGFSYSKLPGLVNNVNTNTDNFTYSGGVVLASNISEYVDFNINYNASINEAKNTTNTSINNRYVNQAAGITLNLLNKKGWSIQNDVSNQSYTGLGEGFNQNYTLWNAAIGKKFLKNKAGELKLSVFDLLKQNQSISRTITESYIQDSQSDVLQQYFMLTFTYSLKNFGTAKTTNNKDDENRGPRGGGGPGF